MELPPIFADDHTLGAKVQAFTGNGKAGSGSAFQWSDRQLTLEEAVAMERVVSTVADRLRVETGVVGGDLQSDLYAEIADLRALVERKDAMLLLAAKQLRNAEKLIRSRR
jgi:hypothetical protein